MKRLSARVFITVAGLAYLAALLISTAGEWLLKHPTAENLRRGIRWNPSNPDLWRATARVHLLSLNDAELRDSVAAYRQTLVRNPFDLLAWQGLAVVESRLGDAGSEEAVLRGWITAIPNSPPAAWALANFLLQSDRPQEAYPYFRRAATYDPSLRLPLFDLGWKLLGDPEHILEELVPPDSQARMEYLSFLVWSRGLVREAYPVWEQLLPAQSEALFRLSESYVGALAAGGYGAEAARAWGELERGAGRTATQPPGELMTNGDFEASLRNAGLDWRLEQGAGFKISLDNFQSHSGSRSLRVQFDGTTNPEFAAVRQWVPVELDTNYHFQAYLRTENISTDSGLFLHLAAVSGPPGEYWERSTEGRIGSNPWTLEQIDFRTGPNTRVIQVELRRKLSTKLNNLLQGSVWLDHVSLQRAEGR